MPGCPVSTALITDIGMPAMDGFELHEVVKKARPDLPVFFITGRRRDR